MNGNVKTEALPVPGVPGAQMRQVHSLPETLEGAVQVGGYSVAKRGALLQTVPHVARFLITDGKLIEFALEEGADPLAAEQFLHGSARAALIHQRGGLPLHAACLKPPLEDFAVAITGRSGAGKSTLAAELVRRGWELLGDDVIPLFATSGRVMAWPSGGKMKLWRDACVRFGIEADTLQALPGERDKYLLPVHASTRPAQLGYIFLLDRGASAGLVEVDGLARLKTLTENTYKPHYLDGMECIRSHFHIACQVAAEVKMMELRCPGTVEESAELLMKSSGL